MAPSTPAQDFRVRVGVWQHHFAALFGLDALRRVRGLAHPEMALPNHPDVGQRRIGCRLRPLPEVRAVLADG